jgi:RimJ/RimL family protein N-acetyltransferase
VRPELAPPLAAFFAVLTSAGDDRLFHPHPLTSEQADAVANYAGADLYYVLCDGGDVLGYGLLRGWDEGYEVPSLGIAMHPAVRGRGLAAPFMHFLHAAAALRGAPRVRLKVYRTNERARALYERLGYSFTTTDAPELVGFREL